jgi:hypothetical protein
MGNKRSGIPTTTLQSSTMDDSYRIRTITHSLHRRSRSFPLPRQSPTFPSGWHNRVLFLQWNALHRRISRRHVHCRNDTHSRPISSNPSFQSNCTSKIRHCRTTKGIGVWMHNQAAIDTSILVRESLIRSVYRIVDKQPPGTGLGHRLPQRAHTRAIRRAANLALFRSIPNRGSLYTASMSAEHLHEWNGSISGQYLIRPIPHTQPMLNEPRTSHCADFERIFHQSYVLGKTLKLAGRIGVIFADNHLRGGFILESGRHADGEVRQVVRGEMRRCGKEILILLYWFGIDWAWVALRGVWVL